MDSEIFFKNGFRAPPACRQPDQFGSFIAVWADKALRPLRSLKPAPASVIGRKSRWTSLNDLGNGRCSYRIVSATGGMIRVTRSAGGRSMLREAAKRPFPVPHALPLQGCRLHQRQPDCEKVRSFESACRPQTRTSSGILDWRGNRRREAQRARPPASQNM